MKKKFFGIASLLCSATLCAGIGVAALSTDADTVVTAATPVYTKTVNGVEYTFEQDFNNLTYSELGDVVNYIPLKTAEGATLRNAPHAAGGYGMSSYEISQADSTFVKSTGGLQFEFSMTGGTTTQADRIEFYFGDIKLNMSRRNSPAAMQFSMFSFASGSSVEVTFKGQPFTNGAAYLGWGASAKLESMAEVKDDLIYLKDGWATFKMHKNKCTAINGDSSAASGYWLTFTMTAQGATTESVLYSGYLNNAMYTDKYDSIGMGFSTPKNLDNYVKVRNTVASAQWSATVCYDVADSAKLIAGGNGTKVTDPVATDIEYMKGKTIVASGYKTNPNGFITTMASQLNRGVEFRMTEKTALTTGSEMTFYMNVWVGSSLLDIYPGANGYFNIRTGWLDTSNNGACMYEFGRATIIPFEVGVEYAVRVVKVAPDKTDRTAGAVVRVYMAKCAADGSLAENWDEAPVYEAYIARDRQVSWNSLNQVGVHPGNNTVAHTMIIRSNKYAGVKTEVNGVETLHKVPYGTDFALADLVTGENTVLVGWSKGADKYSAEDFVVANTVFENMMVSKLDNVYHALTIDVQADVAASLRLRKRADNPLEISLNWKAKVTDSNSLGEYFGGIAFGYKLTAKNAEGQVASTEQEVSKVTDGYTTPYAFSVTQSNIDDYALKFVCQAYVEFEIGGEKVKFYSAEPNVDTDGRSVEYVRAAVLADVRATATGEYVNAVEVNGETKYTYLSAWQYNFINAYIA